MVLSCLVSFTAHTIALSVDCASAALTSRNETRISSALELARKITMYNNRYKTAGNERQEPVVQSMPLLRPRTPVQPYPYFPWQPKGDCLSSTKARLYEPKLVKVQELRKSVSQISLEERKTKNLSQKHSTIKKAQSVAATEGTRWQQTEEGTPHVLKKREVQQLEPPIITSTSTDYQSPRIPATAQLTALETYAQPTQLVGSKVKKKYTGNGKNSRNITGLTPNAIDRLNPPAVKPSSSSTSRFTSSNSFLKTGRQSPVYVAVPVDRPPVKLRSKACISPQDAIDISTIYELRSKLLNVDDSGTLVTYALQNQEDEKPVESSSESDKGGTSLATAHAPSDSPQRVRDELHGVTRTTGLIPWEDNCIQNVGFVTGRHSRKSQSPVVSSGIVQIGKGLGEEAPPYGDSRRTGSFSKVPRSPTRNQDSGAAPSTISLTFQFGSGGSHREQSLLPPQRPPAFPPQFKNFFRPHGSPHR